MKLASIFNNLLGFGIASGLALALPSNNGQQAGALAGELDASSSSLVSLVAKRDGLVDKVQAAVFGKDVVRTTSAVSRSGDNLVLTGANAAMFNASEVEGHMQTPLQERSTDNYGMCFSGGAAVINSINIYRQNARLPLLAWNAERTYTSALTGYNNMIQNLFHTPRHYLFKGSYAQVLSPGINDNTVCSRNINPYTPFQLSWFAWLCEVPKDPAIRTNCPHASKISHLVCPTGAEATGHHDILANRDYKTIGCSFTRNPYGRSCDLWTGFWVCDLGI
jgi:hypothetical protein